MQTNSTSDRSTLATTDAAPDPGPVGRPEIPVSDVIPYSERLSRDPRWALSEGSRFFDGQSNVQDALRKITRRLNDLQIPYSIVGALALFHHGYRRFTEDVDLLVTKEGLKRIHAELDGLGYVPPFSGSKQLRDAELGVKIEFLTTGDFPGDGAPKPVSFPDPLSASFDADGIRYLKLDVLIELKLASGMSSPGRMKDLADVLELIKVLKVSQDYGTRLNPYVREKFDELWRAGQRRFVRLWRKKFLTVDANSLDDMIARLRGAADELEQMKRDGVVLDANVGVNDGYAHLVTTDPKIAEKYGLEDENEFWGPEELDSGHGDGVR